MNKDCDSSGKPVLAVDLGGTKLLVALIEDGRVISRATAATDRHAGPAVWLQTVAELARAWQGRYTSAGVAVTGRVQDGLWSALNANILDIGNRYALQQACEQALGVPVLLANDAQAAAWGEFSHGAGQQRDLVYLTVSTGIGGGIISNGRLIKGRHGLAGHVGQLLPFEAASKEAVLEDQVSGRWIASEALRCGHEMDARGVFRAAHKGEGWAQSIIETSAQRTARLCRNIQMLLDPEIIVMGGGIGLAEGYLEQVLGILEQQPAELRPILVAAALGDESGAIGIADLAKENPPQPSETLS